jgi:hypothetical protein
MDADSHVFDLHAFLYVQISSVEHLTFKGRSPPPSPLCSYMHASIYCHPFQRSHIVIFRVEPCAHACISNSAHMSLNVSLVLFHFKKTEAYGSHQVYHKIYPLRNVILIFNIEPMEKMFFALGGIFQKHNWGICTCNIRIADLTYVKHFSPWNTFNVV